jgi:hypothetical protein
MNSDSKQRPVLQPRVKLTANLLNHLTQDIMGESVTELAKRTGLPYLLIYNITHARVKSLSARHYRIIFGENPPHQEQKKTDGTDFRELVELWLFLNDGITKSDLYREFYGHDHTKRVDYRIFTGETRSVDPGFVNYMQNKFTSCGIDLDTVRRWAHEYAMGEPEEAVAFDRVRPLLMYLNDTLGVHPTTMLDQWFQRYESGELKHVSPKVYLKVLELKKKAEKALISGSRLEIETLKEEIYGRKPGYTLYAQVEEELQFLKKYARRSLKKYLGRSTSMYTRGECRRLPSWRARKILADCRAFIREAPDLPLRALPRSIRKHLSDNLTALLKARTADLLSREEGISLEKQILKPSHASDEYKKKVYGFTRFDMAGQALGMKKTAFDLMVAKNCEIFRKIGTYSRRWYLSDLYLKELSQKRYFDLITAKYEWLAKRLGPSSKQVNACLN